MEVRAADFFSDRPPQRIGGTEFEYNIQSPHEVHESVLLRGQIVSAAFSAAPGIPALAYTRIDKAFILQNGGQLARDVRHTEYDSPEGRGPYEITAGDVAGIPIMQRLAAAGSTAHKGVYRRTGSNLSGVKAKIPPERGIHLQTGIMRTT